jgi:hypothetical protein
MSSSGLNMMLLHDAVRGGSSDVVDVAHDLGTRAAKLGVPLHEVLDLVQRAYAPNHPDFAATRAAAVAWAENALLYHADTSCEDPLTSLATVPHVRSRLAEIYRGAQRHDRRAADTHVLVVVELPRSPVGHELEQALQALDVGEVLRSVYTGDETIAQLTPRRFAALVGRERTDDTTLDLIGILLDRSRERRGQVRLWVERLPASPDGIAQVLAGLCE